MRRWYQPRLSPTMRQVVMQQRGSVGRKLPWLLALLLAQCGGRSISGSDSSSGSGSGSGAGAASGAGGSATTVGANSTGQGDMSTSLVISTASNVTSTTGGRVVSPIPFAEGWAPLEANTLGIQGAFYVVADSFEAGNSLIEGDFAGTRACATGIAAQVLPGPDGAPLYATYWGALMGFNLSQEAGSDTPLPYDAASHGILGFGFNIAGSDPLPPGGILRFNVKVSGDSSIYCTELRMPGLQVAYLSEVRQNCWAFDPTAPTPDLTRLEALHWQYATNESYGYAFDLCINDLFAWVL
jgi:hypothetical protein